MQQPDQLSQAEREYLIKQRANVLDQLAFLERRLGLPSSVKEKQQRRDERRSARDDCEPQSR